MKRIGVLISGGGTNLQSLLDAIDSGEIHGEVAVVISNRRNAYGLVRAQNRGIPAECICKKDYGSDDEFNNALLERLKSYNLDLVVLAGFLSILSREVVEYYKNRIINIHPSLIPSFCGMGYYGEKVHQAVLDYGVKVTGATVHLVDEGADTGPIILQKSIEVRDDDNVQSLARRVLEVEHEILPKAVKLLLEDGIGIEGRRTFIKQDKVLSI